MASLGSLGRHFLTTSTGNGSAVSAQSPHVFYLKKGSLVFNEEYDPFSSEEQRSTHRDSLYICILFLTGALVRHATDVLQIPLPYTVIVFFFGVVGGYLPLDSIVEIGPHTIIYVFLPILIFEGAFAIDVYIFKQIFLQVLILAGPALVVMIALLAVTSMYLFKYEQWTWVIALLFGSILSATDPVAVVAIMKELGTNKRLALLIEGESMLNDGTAMVFFEIFSKLTENPHLTGDAILYMLWISVGGPVFGYIMAKVAIFWLQWTFNDSLTEIAITLSMAYLVFYIADDFLQVSAVLGVVALGATLSEHRTSISPEVEVFLHSFWETLAFMANTMIFAICGFIITRKVIVNAELQDCIYLVILYFAVNVIRLLTIMLFSPVLKRLGYGLTWQDSLVCTWSGLRGAVGLALALIIFKSEIRKLSQPQVGGKILFHVSLIVVSTLLINATTVSHLLTFLGATDVTPARRNAMKKAIKMLDETRQKAMNVWKIDRFLADADWDTVNKLCMIEDPFMSSETTEEKELRERQGGICPRCLIPVPYVPTQSEIHKMLAEATRKYLKLLKQNFWLQFERGLLAGFSVRKLIELAEEAADRDCEAALLLIESQLLVLGIFGMDTMLIIFSQVILVLHGDINPDVDLQLGMENSNILMSLIQLGFFALRVCMFKLNYMTTVWFFFNLVCLVLAGIDISMALTAMNRYTAVPVDVEYHTITSVFIYLRTVRILQVLEVTVGLSLYLINRFSRGRLTVGCDMARGFVRATEVALRLVEHISDDTQVQNTIKENAESDKLSMLRELGLLQGLHPDIALGVKTCQAIRSVLNVMREGMHHLIEEGGIDEPEGQLFVKVIESKMKRLMAAPPRLEIPSTGKILSSIPWINRERDLVEFIIQFAEKQVYHFGDVIMKAGDPPSGIYFIISGLVKVEAPLGSANQISENTVHTIDFLSTGNVIGEISVLTQRPRSATLTCETLVKGLRKEILLSRLENAELEYVDDSCLFDITPQMVDVVLILGECRDEQSGEKYVGPCYIPKTVDSLKFPPKQSPRPLIFYTEKMLLPSTAGTRLSIGAHDRSRSFFNMDFSRVRMQGFDDLNF